MGARGKVGPASGILLKEIPKQYSWMLKMS